MMLKEVMLLESAENEGPEGLWVKVERVGMSRCRGAGVGVGVGGSLPAGPRAEPTSCHAGLPEGGWVDGLAVLRRVTVTPAWGGRGPRADPVDTVKKWNRLGSELGREASWGPHKWLWPGAQGRGDTQGGVAPGAG